MKPEYTPSPDNNSYYRTDNRDANEIKNIIFKFLSNWYWFLIATATAVVIAFIYNRYTSPVYEVHATLLVSEENSNSPIAALYGRNQGMFQEHAFTGRSNIYNQMAVIGSTSIVSMTLSELDFYVSYFSVGRLSNREIYKNAPFYVKWDNYHPQVVEADFLLSIHPDKTLTLSIEEENLKVYNFLENRMQQLVPRFSFQTKIHPDSAITTDYFSFTIVPDENFTPELSGNYIFRFHTLQSLENRYKSLLKVSLPDNNSSILHLAIRDHNIRKGVEFLDKLIEINQYSNLEKKNQYANRTIQFIDSQLQNISDSLNISENRLETFRSNNQMIDFSTQSQQLLIQMNELDRVYMERESKHKYYTYLKNYIDTNQDLEIIIAPSSVGIDDPLLNNFIMQLNELINKKSGMTSIRPDSEHPTFVQLNHQIETVKSSLSHSINNIIEQSNTELESLLQRMKKYSAQISRLPATERNFVNFERRYKIDSETYTFLLQKLSEARIAKASNLPDVQVLEYPQMKAIVKPNKRKAISFAFLIGMVVPAGFLFICDYFSQNKIHTREDIKEITSLPVIGTISHDVKKITTLTPVIDNPNSQLGNAYVSLRTKLHFVTQNIPHPVIAVTSALPKEGKTFNAINIASSVALANKKAVLLDLDLRNSSISKIFNLSPDKGVVNYISGTAKIDEIVFDTKLPALKVIPAGIAPANPAGIFSDLKLTELLEKLKPDYDVIILDTPPVMFVSELFQLRESIDFNIIVVSHDYTPKEALKMVLTELNDHHMNGTGIILNKINGRNGNYNFKKYSYCYS